MDANWKYVLEAGEFLMPLDPPQGAKYTIEGRDYRIESIYDSTIKAYVVITVEYSTKTLKDGLTFDELKSIFDLKIRRL